LWNSKKIKEEIRKEGIFPSKKKGQNFLTDGHAIGGIVNALNISPEDNLLEIGPGTGQLTEHLVKFETPLKVVEIDKEMIDLLEKKIPGIHIIQQDILKADWDFFSGEKYKLVGNLPYYITTAILEKIVEESDRLLLAVVMTQYEVGKRIMAEPGSKEYGRLSLFINNYFEVRFIKKVSGRMFYPPAKVSSMVMAFIPREKTLVPKEFNEIFFHLVKGVFSQRRKNIMNCLKSYPYFFPLKNQLNSLLEMAGIDWKRRGETLNFNEFNKLCEIINEEFKRINREA